MEDRQFGWARRATTRRTALRTGAAGAGLGALFLAACGGDDKKDSGGSTGGAKTLITETAQAATTKQPKPGGSITFQVSAAPPSLDPYTQTSFLNSYVNGLTYSKLY